MLIRDIRVTVLGNTGAGKSTLINRVIGTNVSKSSKKTLGIEVEERLIRLQSSKNYPWYNLEKYRKYKIKAIDNPGDYKLRRLWREALRKNKTDGMIFLLDPNQSIEVQTNAMEDSFNYFLDSLNLNPAKADRIAQRKKYVFYFIVNKCDTFVNRLGNEEEFIITPEIKEKAVDFLANFAFILEEFKRTFPKAKIALSYLSAKYSPYNEVDKLFEVLKVFRYQS
ncbi:MAG: GTPase domain-containing protein [Candidatus Hodarchaeales archaeon]